MQCQTKTGIFYKKDKSNEVIEDICMDRYVDKRELKSLDELNIELDMLLFLLNPCATCTRNQIREDCGETCRLMELWQKLNNEYIKHT